MENPVTEKADALAMMMTQRLGIRRGETLAHKLRIGGRLLPRKIRREAAYIAETEAQAEMPKYAMMVDQARLAQAYKLVRAYLEKVDPADRRKGMLLGILGWLSFNFLLIAGLVIWWMVATGRL